MRLNGSLPTWSLALLLAAGLPAACDDQRVFEDNHEFARRSWVMNDVPVFDFTIPDTIKTYNIYYNVRNSLDYRWRRINVTYALYDSTERELAKKLVYHDLFDATGRPYGESGLGDLYDHQFSLLNTYQFPARGKYSIRLTQFMRQDTLQGILSVGVRVEQNP